MIVGIGNDHSALELKAEIIEFLSQKGHEVIDYGTNSEESCDYPVYGHAVARAVAEGRCEKGIVICTTGIGISIAANKHPGVRCALCADSLTAKLTRQHNDANMLALGGGIVGENLALEIVDAFLDTPFSGEARHQKRVDLIEKL